jgi:hypothetical protein
MKPVSFLLVPAAAALILPVSGGWAKQAPLPAVKLSLLRQTDKRGPALENAAIRTSDALVWAVFAFDAPLEKDADFVVRWMDSAGKIIVDADVQAEKGAKDAASGLKMAGRSHAKAGKFRVTVFAKGDLNKPLAQNEFAVAEPTLDNTKPKFTAALAPSLDTAVNPVAPTTQFYSDNKIVWLAMKAEKGLSKGHTLTPKIFDPEGNLVAFGKPIEYSEGSDKLGTGFYIAGQDWAKAGGKFTFKVYWDEDPRPIAESAFAVSAANRYAVLIGIEDYLPAGKDGDLPGCRLDTANMKSLLIETYGMPEDHVKVVADLDATKANIEKALMELADKAKPGDAAIIHYSGHGAQVPDLDGDEADGWDEAIVPNEPLPALLTTEAEVNRLITDDRLAELLARFKTKNVTVMFDSCHSGTAVRAGEQDAPEEFGVDKFRTFDFSRRLLKKAQDARRTANIVRVPRTKLASFIEHREEGLEQEPRSDDAVGVGSQFVFVASSRPWETSGCNRFGGFFTNSLIAGLKSSNGQSWDQVIPGVRDMTSDRRPGQNPSVEGAIRRLPFTLQEVGADAPYVRPFASIVGAFKPESDTAKAAPRIEEGTAGSHRAVVEGYQSLYMEQNGALYDVYPKGDNTFAGKPVGRVKLTGKRERVANFGREELYSTAEIVSGAVHTGDRLVPVCVAVPDRKVKVGVFVSNNAPEADKTKLIGSARSLMDALGKNSLFSVLTTFKFSDVDYVVEPRFINGQMTAYLWSSGGWRMANFAGKEEDITTKTVGFIMQRHDTQTRLARIGNPSPAFRFVADIAGEPQVYKGGDSFSVQVEAGQASHVLFAFALPDGSVSFVDGGEVKPGLNTYKLTAPKADGAVVLKILATRDKLDANKMNVGGGASIDEIASSLRGKYGDGGAGLKYIGTDGWADATLRLSVGK